MPRPNLKNVAFILFRIGPKIIGVHLDVDKHLGLYAFITTTFSEINGFHLRASIYTVQTLLYARLNTLVHR